MRKYRLGSCVGNSQIFCVLFVIARLSVFAQSNSNKDDDGAHGATVGAVNTASWETRDLPNLRLRFKLAPGYKLKHWAVVVGDPGPVATFQLGDFNEIRFSVENLRYGTSHNAKMPRQDDYLDYKEWTQLIGGRQAIVQTFQGGGQIIDKNGTRLPYRVAATCPMDDKHLVCIDSSLDNKERQQEVLALLKTIEFYAEENKN